MSDAAGATGPETPDTPDVRDASGPAASEPRSVRRSLASIVLGFEIIVVFLAALVISVLNTLLSKLVLD